MQEMGGIVSASRGMFVALFLIGSIALVGNSAAEWVYVGIYDLQRFFESASYRKSISTVYAVDDCWFGICRRISISMFHKN